MNSFLYLLGTHRREYFAVTFCASLVVGGESLIHPLLMKAIFDQVSAHDSFYSFIPLGVAYLGLGLSINLTTYYVSNWKNRVDNRVIEEVSAGLLRAYFTKEYVDVLRNGVGYYVARIRSDVKDGLTPVLISFRDLIVNLVSFVALISVLIYISWQAFLVLIFVIPLSAFVSRLVSKRIHALTSKERDTEATIVDVLSRSIAAFKIVRGFSVSTATVRHYSENLSSGSQSSYEKLRMVRRLQGVGDLTMVLSDVSSIFVGALLVSRKAMTIGSFIAFMNAFWRSSSTLISVLNKWAELQGNKATLDRIIDFKQGAVALPFYSIGADVWADHVGYSYDETVVVRDFSIRVGLGERTLIVGENGSGKTTIANILCGFLYPTHGKLVLPPRVSGATLPTHFPPTLVGDLPIDKVLLTRFSLDGEAVEKSRPDFLSAGQQQKLAVLMALSADSDLYVLDEPLANLDPGSRGLMMETIIERTVGKMLVMIAHDGSLWNDRFDNIVDISIGRKIA